VTAPARDRWADWLLERRHGGDAEQLANTLRALEPVRDRVLDNARLDEGDTVLDVGCGDGLIGFGALDRVGSRGRVIFSDVSVDLLDLCRQLAEAAGLTERSAFVEAPAQDLSAIAMSSVDVVTTRSVVIYVPLPEKRLAFEEFFRVLQPGGRLSMFEPINRFGSPEPDDRFLGLDVGPVQSHARKVKAAFEQASCDATLIDFDERDLLTLAERAGFDEIVLDYRATIERGSCLLWGGAPAWDVFLHSSPNPNAPTLDEALDEALSPEEREEFVAYLRSAFEGNKGVARYATAYLRAVRH
jgi:arsenite methyltransferase